VAGQSPDRQSRRAAKVIQYARLMCSNSVAGLVVSDMATVACHEYTRIGRFQSLSHHSKHRPQDEAVVLIRQRKSAEVAS
jgi:hypothetical protein